MARRVRPYGSGEKGKAEGSKAARRPAPPAPKGNTRAGKTLVRSAQPEKLVTIDGDTLEDTRALVVAAMESAATNKPAFEPFAELLVTEWHHVRVCAPFVGLMSVASQRVHVRRVKNVSAMFAEAGLTPTAAQRLGLMNAKEMEARVMVKPVRSKERARVVAGLLSQYGVIPPEEPIDATVVEDTPAAEADTEPDYGNDTPPPLPEADRRDLNVRSIFDR